MFPLPVSVREVQTPLDIPEIAGEYIAADKPETSAAFPASHEVDTGSNPNLTTGIEPSPSQTCSLQ